MRLARLPFKWIIAIVGLMATAIIVNGCGGGGGGGGNGGGGGGGAAGTYNYSGTVTDINGNPLAGVTVDLDGSGTYISATTTSAGTWSISNVPQSFISAQNTHTLDVNYNNAVYPNNLPSADFATPGTYANIPVTANAPPPPPAP